MTAMQRIGFVGLGAMGFPMASQLLKAGHDVTGFDLDSTALENFQKLGGDVSGSLSILGAKSSFVITMLPNGRIVRDALLAENGVLSTARPNTLVVDMSSSDPMDTRALGLRLNGIGFRLVDAPVSGGVRKASDGTLAIMVGGQTEDITEVRVALQSIGKNIFHVGDLGSGHAAKALNNFVSAAGLVAMCEAFLIAEKFGIDLEKLTDVFNASTGKSNSTELKAKPFIIPRNFKSGFALSLMAKDIETARGMARALSVEASALESSANLWSTASSTLGIAADHTAIFDYLERLQEE